MTTTIRVARGLCSPLRDDVLTAIEPFGVRVLNINAWGEGHWHIPCPDLTPFPDADIWVRKHICDVTVSDAQAKWAERLLWQSGKCNLESKPLNPSLEWTAPPDCKAGAHGTLGRGTMPTPWSDNPDPRWWERRKRKPARTHQRKQRTTKRTRQARNDEGWISKLFKGIL